ncbi:MAG TPA: peptide chain release factor 1 [Verrucomicrobiales bacterium]|nr:peptide chain release factor 1 [Verrucomicrobiales bacterium]
MVPLDKLALITERFEYLEARLSSGAPPAEIARLSREYSDLKPVVAEIAAYRQALTDLADAEAMLADPDLRALAEDEIPTLRARIPQMEQALRLALLPRDAADARPAILEIRPGTGGEEAALFAGDLLRMYQRHAEQQGWQFDLLELSQSDLGGVKEATARISGEGVFARLKYESGVHRVQRVPATENQGRIHTSAATVAVLPEAEEVDFELKSDEVRIEVCRSSGAGGQGVNTTDSAVQVLHIPTGTIVRCQDGRSQIKNKEKALSILRSRLLEKKQQEEAAKYSANRKSLIGGGGREEKIRTYNYPQNRVTDHRIELTLYNLDQFVEGRITDMLQALLASDLKERLAEAGLN